MAGFYLSSANNTTTISSSAPSDKPYIRFRSMNSPNSDADLTKIDIGFFYNNTYYQIYKPCVKTSKNDYCVVIYKIEDINNSNNYIERICRWKLTSSTSASSEIYIGSYYNSTVETKTFMVMYENASSDSYRIGNDYPYDFKGHMASYQMLSLCNINEDNTGLIGVKVTETVAKLKLDDVQIDNINFSDSTSQNYYTKYKDTDTEVTGSFYLVKKQGYKYELIAGRYLKNATIKRSYSTSINDINGLSYEQNDSLGRYRPGVSDLILTVASNDHYNLTDTSSSLIINNQPITGDNNIYNYSIPYIQIQDSMGGYTDDNGNSFGYIRVYPCTSDFTADKFKLIVDLDIYPSECSFDRSNIITVRNTNPVQTANDSITITYERISTEHKNAEANKFYYDDVWEVVLERTAAQWRNPRINSLTNLIIGDSSESTDRSTYQIQLKGYDTTNHKSSISYSIEYNLFSLKFDSNFDKDEIFDLIITSKDRPNYTWTSHDSNELILNYGEKLHLEFSVMSGYKFTLVNQANENEQPLYNEVLVKDQNIFSYDYTVRSNVNFQASLEALRYQLTVESYPQVITRVEHIYGPVALHENNLTNDHSDIYTVSNTQFKQSILYYDDQLAVTYTLDDGYSKDVAALDAYVSITKDITIDPKPVPTEYKLTKIIKSTNMTNAETSDVTTYLHTQDFVITRIDSPIHQNDDDYNSYKNQTIIPGENGTAIYYHDVFSINEIQPNDGYKNIVLKTFVWDEDIEDYQETELSINGSSKYTFTLNKANDIILEADATLKSWKLRFRDESAPYHATVKVYRTEKNQHMPDAKYGSDNPIEDLQTVYYFDKLEATPKAQSGYKLTRFVVPNENSSINETIYEGNNIPAKFIITELTDGWIAHSQGSISQFLAFSAQAQANGMVWIGDSINSSNFTKGWNCPYSSTNNYTIIKKADRYIWIRNAQEDTARDTKCQMICTTGSTKTRRLSLNNNIELVMDYPGYEWCIITNNNNADTETPIDLISSTVSGICHTENGDKIYQSTLIPVRIMMKELQHQYIYIAIRTSRNSFTSADQDIIDNHTFFNIIPFSRYFVYGRVKNEQNNFVNTMLIPYVALPKPNNSEELGWYVMSDQDSLMMRQGNIRQGILNSYYNEAHIDQDADKIALQLSIPASLSAPVRQSKTLTLNCIQSTGDNNLRSEYYVENPTELNLNRVTAFKFNEPILSLPLDPPQLLFKVTSDNGLLPGYYYFEIGDVPYSFYYDLFNGNEPVPIPKNGGFRYENRKLYIYASDTVTVLRTIPVDENKAFGQYLGKTFADNSSNSTIQNDENSGGEFNYYNPSLYGSNDFASSWLKQWFNSNEETFTFQQNGFHRNIPYQIPGFLNLFNRNLDAVMGKIRLSDNTLTSATFGWPQGTNPSEYIPIQPTIYFI